MGRKKMNNSLKHTCQIRINNDDYVRLENLADTLGGNKSFVFRKALKYVFTHMLDFMNWLEEEK